MLKNFIFLSQVDGILYCEIKKVVKLPIDNYLPSLKNFLLSQGNTTFDKYKIFDYRIKEQLILN